MSGKSIVMVGMVAGSLAGSYVPMIFGVSAFSYTSLLGGFIGGIGGIWLAYKFVRKYI
jgi:hypothetical protein